MILPGFPALVPAKASSVFPAVTVGRADIGGFGTLYGYIRAGGIAAALYGVSGGTLSASLVQGFVTEVVVRDGLATSVVFAGDCAALLSGVTALMDNGTPLPITYPFVYESDNNVTLGTFDGFWTATGNRTVQLV
jgi:hypothetical protein